MSIGDGDIDLFFADFNSCELQDGTRFGCILDLPEAMDPFSSIGGRVGAVVGRPTMRYATKSADLVNDQVVTIDGTQWKVRGPARQVNDGLESVVELKNA